MEHQKQIYMALQDKNHCLASKASASSHYRRGQQERIKRIPKAGNLVFVKNHVVDEQREKKLENKWLRPRLLVSLSLSEFTERVKKLYEKSGTKKYYLNNLILYIK